eukprot:TRINITY_DN11069_c0_g1_i1.p1 TRINITY_DN11069_c0_g1~~TRINITY_DN11069_c0_g1_i1.p1  ORF type:complete len:315 (+),score=-22.63 TRINITY_DN11069_c0_g1_i1:59-946(+)
MCTYVHKMNSLLRQSQIKIEPMEKTQVPNQTVLITYQNQNSKIISTYFLLIVKQTTYTQVLQCVCQVLKQHYIHLLYTCQAYYILYCVGEHVHSKVLFTIEQSYLLYSPSITIIFLPQFRIQQNIYNICTTILQKIQYGILYTQNKLDIVQIHTIFTVFNRIAIQVQNLTTVETFNMQKLHVKFQRFLPNLFLQLNFCELYYYKLKIFFQASLLFPTHKKNSKKNEVKFSAIGYQEKTVPFQRVLIKVDSRQSKFYSAKSPRSGFQYESQLSKFEFSLFSLLCPGVLVGTRNLNY